MKHNGLVKMMRLGGVLKMTISTLKFFQCGLEQELVILLGGVKFLNILKGNAKEAAFKSGDGL